MNLLLWRHAEAHEGTPDLARELTPRGRRQAARVAAWLKAHGPDDPQVIVSPAQRTLQTADALGRAYQVDERLAPDADLSVHLAAAGWGLREERDRVGERSVLLVGHQPTLGQLASLLLAGIEQDWSVKKGALWWLHRRRREERSQVILRAVVSPELLQG